MVCARREHIRANDKRNVGGTVSDATRALIPGVTITATNTQTESLRWW